MVINKRTYIFSLLIIFVNVLNGQDIDTKEHSDTISVINGYSASIDYGFFIQTYNERINKIDNDDIIMANGLGTSFAFNLYTSLIFSKRLKFNIGLSILNYNSVVEKVNTEYLNEDSLLYDNTNYEFFKEHMYFTSLIIPISRFHTYRANKRLYFLFEYGILFEIPLKINSQISYKKINENEENLDKNYSNVKQIAFGFNIKGGIFYKVSNNVSIFTKIIDGGTFTSTIKGENNRVDRVGLTLELGIKFNPNI